MASEEHGVRFDPVPPAVGEEHCLLEALRNGDEGSFIALVERYRSPLVRLAMVYVGDPAVAEEVVQETWIGVLRGIDQFEGRSSLRTWLFRILTNQAKARAMREGRSVPFSALEPLAADPAAPAVDPARFFPPGHEDAGHWISPLRHWEEVPEAYILASETRACIREAIDRLPPAQRAVITLRDVEGLTATDVCQHLSLSDANQRVLLHRARSALRRMLEHDLDERL